jgi:hypothetical protein
VEEEREKIRTRDPEGELEKTDSEDDVEAHKQRVRLNEEATDEAAGGDDDVELHKQRSR